MLTTSPHVSKKGRERNRQAVATNNQQQKTCYVGFDVGFDIAIAMIEHRVAGLSSVSYLSY